MTTRNQVFFLLCSIVPTRYGRGGTIHWAAAAQCRDKPYLQAAAHTVAVRPYCHKIKWKKLPRVHWHRALLSYISLYSHIYVPSSLPTPVCLLDCLPGVHAAYCACVRGGPAQHYVRVLPTLCTKVYYSLQYYVHWISARKMIAAAALQNSKQS